MAVLALAILSAVLGALQFPFWLSVVRSGDGWGALALVFVLPGTAAVLGVVVLLPSIILLSREPNTVSRWAFGLALAAVLLLVIELLVLGAIQLHG